MNKIPIVFCFDDNLLMPAGICIDSLLMHARQNTFYDIFILHDDYVKYPNSGYLERLKDKYPNHNITYRSVGNNFKDAFQIRGINQVTYYRLLIPELIPEYDKIMYHDVDVIFRSDLSSIFEETNVDNYYIAGVVSPVSLDGRLRSYITSLGVEPENYISAGNIILNSALLKKDGVIEVFKNEVKTSNYEFQDMDIINKVCVNKILKMSPVFCGTIEVFELASYRDIPQIFYNREELNKLLVNGIIHYNGVKPWVGFCPNFDVWWEIYRKSVYYDPKFYFNFFISKLDDLDRLSFYKRLKLLFRYFKVKK